MNRDELIDKICQISGFLAGYGDAAEIAAERLRRLMDEIEAELPSAETVVAAAHLYRLEGSDDPRAVPVAISAPPPARHHNLFALVERRPDESGFLTSTGRFVDRREALQIALASGQPLIDHPSRHPQQLFSEDLW